MEILFKVAAVPGYVFHVHKCVVCVCQRSTNCRALRLLLVLVQSDYNYPTSLTLFGQLLIG